MGALRSNNLARDKCSYLNRFCYFVKVKIAVSLTFFTFILPKKPQKNQYF